VPCFTARVNAR